MSVAAPDGGDLLPQVDGGGAMRMGLLGLALLLGVGGGWAATTRIGGAVVSGGQVVAAGRPQLVQSLDGGIVREIGARNGDRVAAGQVLLRLDPTLVETNLGIARARLADALALRARLEAEQAGLPAPDLSPGALGAGLPFPAPDAGRQAQAQARIFAARAEVLAGGRAQLAEALDQSEARISGIAAQIAAKQEEAALLDEDLASMAALSERGLVRQSDLNDRTRARAAVAGAIAALEAERAAARLAMRDAELATLQEERAFREAVVTDLREAAATVDELVLEIVTRSAELDRTVVRSPAAGVVHEMQAATLGGVVAPGATIGQVMPLDGGLAFEVRVDPRSIDNVHVGQAAEIMIAPLDPAATPRLEATVTGVSADAVPDERTGQSFYRVTLAVPPPEIERLGGATLIPGMPIEAYLGTGDRTVLAYLVHPLASQVRRAFRES